MRSKYKIIRSGIKPGWKLRAGLMGLILILIGVMYGSQSTQDTSMKATKPSTP